ncbi:dihydroorotate dehydrogenase-like protein [Magnetospira thiophila]
MADLTTTYMGLQLDNPLVVSSSGITGQVSGIERCADAGAGAVVLKSMFEELILAASKDLDKSLIFSGAGRPEVYDYVDIGKSLGPMAYLEFIEKVRRQVSLPVIASINCVSPKQWVSYARSIESAGADALELNISYFPLDEEEDSRDIEARYVQIVREVIGKVSIPVAVKIGSHFTSPLRVMRDVVAAGAKALVLFNRYHTVDVDLGSKRLVSAVKFSSPSEQNLPLRWVGLAAERLDCHIAASTGISDTESVLKMLMVGATVTQVCSTLYRNGPKYLSELRSGLSAWLDEEGHASVDEIRGLALRNAEDGEKGLLTRLQYIKNLEEATSSYEF